MQLLPEGLPRQVWLVQVEAFAAAGAMAYPSAPAARMAAALMSGFRFILANFPKSCFELSMPSGVAIVMPRRRSQVPLVSDVLTGVPKAVTGVSRLDPAIVVTAKAFENQ